jgi:Fe-S-cluster-containing dehydrogenase component
MYLFYTLATMDGGGLIVGLEGPQMVLFFDPARCTGCRSCETACSFEKYQVCSYTRSHIRHFFNPEKEVFEARYCFHCETPLCAEACPVDAIRKDERTGIVKIDPIKCIGCQLCNFICPLSAPWFDEERRVSVKCDLCDGNPECVKFCSPQALRFITRDEAKRLLKEIYH